MIYYKKKIQQDVGATAVEYGILSALIAVVTILGLQATGTNLGTTYCTIANQLSQAVGAGNTASGCSAPSSGSSGSSSSSSSADGSGSSADSSSSSGSSAASSSNDSSAKTVYNASNSYSIIPYSAEYPIFLEDLMRIGQKKVTSLKYIMADSVSVSGIYDDSGNELKNGSDIAAYLGVTSEYNSAITAQKTQYTSPSLNNNKISSDADIALQHAPNNKTLYVPDISKVSFSGLLPNGTTFKTENTTSKVVDSISDIGGSYTVTNSNGEASTISLGYKNPTN